MASNRRSREARLLEPLLARRPNELPDNALGPTINDIYQAIAAHKAGHDHDWIYFTKDEIINMWLGIYNPNILIPAVPGAGILFDGNVVKIDTSRDYSWLGMHTFAAEINGTISNATNAGNADTLGGQHSTYFLPATAQAADSAKLGNVAAASYPTFTDWTNWAPSPTGWSSITQILVRYMVVGKLVNVSGLVKGTSNSTTTSIPLPVNSANISGMFWGGATNAARDNGVALTYPSRWNIGANSNVLTFYKDFAGGTWTASGIKEIYFTIFYEGA